MSNTHTPAQLAAIAGGVSHKPKSLEEAIEIHFNLETAAATCEGKSATVALNLADRAMKVIDRAASKGNELACNYIDSIVTGVSKINIEDFVSNPGNTGSTVTDHHSQDRKTLNALHNLL